MKRFIYFFLGLFSVTAFLAACTDQDDTYKQYVKEGGYVYPQQANGLGADKGYKRVRVAWPVPKDPSIRTGRVYWNNRQDSINIDYTQLTGDSVEVFITNLEEHSYTVEVINYDGNGNSSMVKEITITPYGDNWLAQHAGRSVNYAELLSSGDAYLELSQPTNEMRRTEIRYLTTSGDSATVTLENNVSKINLPNAVGATRVSLRSLYKPDDGLDSVWGSWLTASLRIFAKLDCSSWTAKATTGQVWDSNYLEKNIFDGSRSYEPGHRWFSANGSLAKVFPKIMAIDMGKDGYEIYKFLICQHPWTWRYDYSNKVEIYMGDEPFDPDAGSDYASSPGFAHAAWHQDVTFWHGTNIWTRSFGTTPMKHRYMAIVWKNSYSKNGWIGVTEVEFYGLEPEDD